MRFSLLSRRLALAALVAALLAACAAGLRHATSQDVGGVAGQWPGTTVADLDRGRALYVRRCAGCHTLVLPRAYPAGDWPAYVDAMADRAHLTPGEKTDVTRFLVALARPGAPR